jgi:hypothetical protein
LFQFTDTNNAGRDISPHFEIYIGWGSLQGTTTASFASLRNPLLLIALSSNDLRDEEDLALEDLEDFFLADFYFSDFLTFLPALLPSDLSALGSELDLVFELFNAEEGVLVGDLVDCSPF